MRRGGIANKDPSSPSYRFTELQRGPPTQDVSPRLSVEPRGNEKRKHRGEKNKKRARNPVLKTAAGTSCSSASPTCRPPSAAAPSVSRPVPPSPGGRGHSAGRSGAERPLVPTQRPLPRVSPTAPGAAGIPTRGASPTLSPTLRWQLSGRRSHSPGKQTHSITYFLPIDNSVNPSHSVFCSDSVTHLICWQ